MLAIKPSAARVLVVDDDPSILEAIRRVLASPLRKPRISPSIAAHEVGTFNPASCSSGATHFTVETASSGESALRAVQDTLARDLPSPHVAIVDMRMPNGWDGAETCRRLWEVLPDLHVILCTASADHRWDDVVRGLGGSTANLLFLKKPFESAELRQMVLALSAKAELVQRTRVLEQAHAQKSVVEA